MKHLNSIFIEYLFIPILLHIFVKLNLLSEMEHTTLEILGAFVFNNTPVSLQILKTVKNIFLSS